MPSADNSFNSRKLYHQLVHYPQEIIPLMDHVVSEIFVELCHEAGDTDIVTEDFAGIKVGSLLSQVSGIVKCCRPLG
jgi:DNA replicative helicase MCM subunit Mcm2 (Cdc46/Mcm family)